MCNVAEHLKVGVGFMTRRGLTAAMCIGVLCALSVQADESAALQKQVRDVELALAELRISIPDAGDEAVADIGTAVERRANDAHVKPDVTISEPAAVPLANGQPSSLVLYHVGLKGAGKYSDVMFFLHLLAHSRAFGVASGIETLTLRASGANVVAFEAGFVRGAWKETPPPRSPGDGTTAADRMNAALRTRLSWLSDTISVLSETQDRYDAAGIIDAISVLNEKAADEAVALTRIDVKGDVTLQGVVLGSRAGEAFKKTLAEAGFTVKGWQPSAAGVCRGWTITAALKKIDRGEALPVGSGLFDSATAATCAPRSAAGSPVVVPRGKGADLWSLHARDLDVVDVFRVLNDLGSGNFVIDHDVTGRTSIDATDAEAAQIVAAVMKSERLSIDPGLARRVRRAASPARVPREQKWNGEPITMTIKAATVADLLCMLGNLTGLKPSIVNGGGSDVSIFASDVPWDALIEVLFSSAGSTYKIDGDRFGVAPIGSKASDPSRDACGATPYHRTWWRLQPAQLDAPLLEIAAIAASASKSTAYAYAPGEPRLLMALHVGDAIGSSRVAAIDADGVRFDSTDGATTLRLGQAAH
jgi:hypothetical protein